MKFLLDVHLGTSLASLLETQGHSCRLVADVADPRSKDEDILELAFKNQEVVLTHDLDFGKLLAFSKQERPSVIIFRIEKISSVVFYQLLMNNWDDYASIAVHEGEITHWHAMPECPVEDEMLERLDGEP